MKPRSLRTRWPAVPAALGLALFAITCGGEDPGTPGGSSSSQSTGGGQGGRGGSAGAGGEGGIFEHVCPDGQGGSGGAGGAGGSGGAGGGSEGTFGFTPARRYPAAAGAGNAAVALADMNRDGRRDLVVINTLGAFVSVLLGAGDGSFKEAHRTYLKDHLPVTRLAESLAVTDFNGDGVLDVAVHGRALGLIVLLGQGCGVLAPPVAYPTSYGGEGPVVAADLDSDGDADLVTVHGTTSAIDVLFNDGAGAFPTLQTSVVAGAHDFAAVAAADVDGDNLIDVVVANQSTSATFLLRGAGGGVLSGATLLSAKRARSIALGDLTGDGRPEIILGSTGDGASGIGVLTNNGNGTFQPIVFSNQGVEMDVRAVADLDDDGAVDVIGKDAVTGALLVAMSAGGSLSPATALPAGGRAQGVAAADVDGDILPDLVAGNDSPGLAFLRGNGDGTFQAAALSRHGAGARAIATGDFNSDGAPDVLFGGHASSITVLRSTAGGGLEDAGAHDIGNDSRRILALDANGDGHLDIINVSQCASFPCSSFEVALGYGDGTFQPMLAQLHDFPVSDAAAGDVDGDGDIDVYASEDTANYGATLMRNNGDGTFTPGFAPGVDALGLTDFDGDGTLDVAASADGFAFVRRGNGDGTYQSPEQLYPLDGYGGRIAVGEFNGDGHPDFVVTSGAGVITIFYGAGNVQSLTPAQIDLNAGAVASPLAADLDGDGWQDLAVIADGRVLVLRSDGGFFEAGPVITAVRDPSWLAAADIDVDGHLDLLVTSAARNELVVLLSTL